MRYSTMDTGPNSETTLASQYALRVALQTMKERCIVLQRRLATVEEENQELRERVDQRLPTQTTNGNNGNVSNPIPGSAAEMLQLRLNVAELNRQKQQLSEHINMVSNENRKLWSRLSQLAKEQGRTLNAENDCTLINDTEAEVTSSPRNGNSGVGGVGGANQNLIRSKTFTQHSPNPNLRHTVICTNTIGDTQDLSMEEVALDAYDESAAMTGAGEDYATATEAELGFAYLNVDDGAASVDAEDADFNLEAKKCIEGLQGIRREAMKQQQHLNQALAALETRIALQPCAECAQKSEKPEMADKSLETDDSLSEIRPSTRHGLDETTTAITQRLTTSVAATTEYSPHLNIIQEKIKADAMDRMCPMCGKMFSSVVPFESFQQHVEVHFIDDGSDGEASLERNYEFISHAVGDF